MPYYENVVASTCACTFSAQASGYFFVINLMLLVLKYDVNKAFSHSCFAICPEYGLLQNVTCGSSNIKPGAKDC